MGKEAAIAVAAVAESAAAECAKGRYLPRPALVLDEILQVEEKLLQVGRHVYPAIRRSVSYPAMLPVIW